MVTPAPRWSALQTPAFSILGITVALSALFLAVGTIFTSLSTPWAAAATLPVTLVAGAAWLTALLRLADPVERRPAWLVAFALAWGGALAVAVGLLGGLAVDLLVAQTVSPTFAADWGAAIAAPYAEEIGKGAGVVMVLLVARPYLTTVWSGALYGALVGVGFALTEDAVYALTAADDVLPDDVEAALSTLALRSVALALVGHPLFTATAGAGIAYAWLRRDRSPRQRLGVLAAALSGAMLMHAAVNSPVSHAATSALAALSESNAMAGYLLVVVAFAGYPLWWLVQLRRSDARMLLTRAAALAPETIQPDEVKTLASVRARRSATRRIRRLHGAEAARRHTTLRRAQLCFTAATAQPYLGYPAFGPFGLAPPLLHWSQEAATARHGVPDINPAADVPLPPTRATTAAATAVLTAATAGLLFSPAALLAILGAAVLRWRKVGGRLATIATLSALFSAYSAATTLLIAVLF
ncbi:PrsW family intramembrane metalloprotease [Actinoplanes sp. NPDC051859]|uniref:PrsW family intramembrane metalloprotease n=1 Tax=Actinoplanes sp. NPDC051859 TaxID=3363909 RepID=UPI0037AE0F59